MNILIIDDLLLPDAFSADSSKKAIFYRLFEENKKRRLFLAREFSRLGANVLLATLNLTKTAASEAFLYKSENGINRVIINIYSKKGGFSANIKERLSFCSLLSENAPGLAGLFRPEVVIAGGVFPFSVSCGAKIAEACGAVLITELCCDAKAVLRRLGLSSFINPVLGVINRCCEKAFDKSFAVLGLFPAAAERFFGAHNLYRMDPPMLSAASSPSEKAEKQKESLFAFRESEAFVLVFPGKLEEGYSIEELILSSASFGKKLALVFLSDGKKKAFFRRFVAEKGITNVFFSDDAEEEDIPHILSAADGIFLSENEFLRGSAPETEVFFAAFSAGKPVVACSEHYADFFRKSGGAIITKPRRKDSITLGIRALMSMNESDRAALGRALKTFYEKNTSSFYAEEMFSLFDNLVKQKEIKK